MAEHTLTRNQRLVLEALTRQAAPRSAYGLLDDLRPEGLRAPQQIYRALAQLMEAGLVHRIESANAYVACRHEAPGEHPATVFLVCRDCETADEIADEGAAVAIAALCEAQGFAAERSTVEVHGRCAACRAAAPGG